MFAKSAHDISTQLKAAVSSQAPLRLDPVTQVETGVRAIAMVSCVALIWTAPSVYNEGLEENFVNCMVAVVSALAILFALTYKEYWEIDPGSKRIRATSSWLGMKSHSVRFGFEDIVSVAVSWRFHSSNTRSSCQYGLAVLTRDGTLHEIFPNLSDYFDDICVTVKALAEFVEAPLLEPVRARALEVITDSGTPELVYFSE